MSKKDKDLVTFDNWQCQTCEGQPVYETEDFKKHLQEAHGIDYKTAKGAVQMVAHLDGRDWYQSNYEVTVGGLKFMHYVRNKRDKRTAWFA